MSQNGARRSIVPRDAGYQLNFGDGGSVLADLVMGCDGAWSKVRSLRSSTKPFYSGVTFVETRLTSADTRNPSVSSLIGQGNILALGDNKGLMAQRNGDGHIRIYIALRVPEDWVKPRSNHGTRRWFKRGIWREQHPVAAHNVRFLRNSVRNGRRQVLVC